MGSIKVIILIFGLLVIPFSKIKAQNEYLNMIENELYFNLDNLTDDWIFEDIIDAEIQLQSYSLTERFRIRSMGSSSFKFGDDEMKRRFRFSAKNRRIKLSLLAQNDHQTAGVEINPVPEKIKLLFGDFGFSHGIGLVFSSRRRFNSWLQNPHQQLYRAGGLLANTSSDTSSFLRGGGVSYHFGRVKLDAFFGVRGDGVFLNYKSDRLHLGFGGSKFEYKAENYVRLGPYIKWRLAGGILFGELAVQNNKGRAYEFGYSFFGNDRQSFILRYSYYSKGVCPQYSVLDFTKIATTDQRSIGLNYKWELRSNWFFQADLRSQSALFLPDRGLSPNEEWKFRIAIIKLIANEGQFVSRIVGSDEGMRAIMRWRIGFEESKNFIQFESGWSRKASVELNYPQNYYLAFDMRLKIIPIKWDLNTGISMYQSDDQSIPLYRYEPDLLYSMSIPALSGSGMRGYIKLRYSLNEDLRIEIKYSRSLKYSHIGEEAMNQVKFQIIYSTELKLGNS